MREFKVRIVRVVYKYQHPSDAPWGHGTGNVQRIR